MLLLFFLLFCCSSFLSTTTRCFTSESTFDAEDEEDDDVLLSILILLLLSGVGFHLTSTIWNRNRGSSLSLWHRLRVRHHECQKNRQVVKGKGDRRGGRKHARWENNARDDSITSPWSLMWSRLSNIWYGIIVASVKRYSLFLFQLFSRVNVWFTKLEEQEVFMCVWNRKKRISHTRRMKKKLDEHNTHTTQIKRLLAFLFRVDDDDNSLERNVRAREGRDELLDDLELKSSFSIFPDNRLLVVVKGERVAHPKRYNAHR